MNWHLIHTKPRQEKIALQNLQQQGYECYLPMLILEKICRKSSKIVEEALFPRYLFICLDSGKQAKSWSPIRSTKGVNRLVCFGTEPAKVDTRLIEILRKENQTSNPKPAFSCGDRVIISSGAFAGIEALYQITDGEQRSMVLIEMLCKSVEITVNSSCLRKVG